MSNSRPVKEIHTILGFEKHRLLADAIVSHPECAAGWKDFDARMRAFDIQGFDATRQELADRARTMGGRKIFIYSNFLRLAISEAAELAFHYRMTESKASLVATKKIFSYLLEEPYWRAQGPQNGWQSDLWTADYACAAGLIFDHLGAALGADEKKLWAQVIHERGIEPVYREWIAPQTRIHALDSMGHNWWSVCVSGSALALFSIRQFIPDADSTLRLICDSFVEFFHYPGNVLQNKKRTFGEQGDYIESISYLDYTLHNLTLIFDLCREHLQRDLPAELPFLKNVCDYYMANLQPLKGSMQRLNFGNMGSGPNTLGHKNPALLWLATEFQRDDLFHLARQLQPAPSCFQEFLFWPTGMSGESYRQAPGDTVFENTGLAVLRDGYASDSTVFAIKSGMSWNHNQADSPSYILSSGGVEFLTDPGTTEYSSPLHGSYFTTSHAHNVVLHNGRGQNEELNFLGTKHSGSIPTWLFAPGYRYLLADACGPWEGIYSRYYRHVFWIGDFILIVDDLMAYETGDWTSLLHYEGELEIIGHQILVRNSGKTLAIHPISPSPKNFETKTGHRSQKLQSHFKLEYQVTEQPYLAVHFSGTDRREKILQLLELPDGTEKTVNAIEEGDVVGVRVAQDSGTWEIFCNKPADGRVMHRNSELLFRGIRTDAFLFAHHTKPCGTMDRISLHNGSYFFFNGRMLYSALIKSDVVIEFDHSTMVIHSSLSAATWASMETSRPSSCPENATWRDGLLRIHLPAGRASTVLGVESAPILRTNSDAPAKPGAEG